MKYICVHMFLERTGLAEQLCTHVSREDWSGRTAGYTCFLRGLVWPNSCVHMFLEGTGLDVQLGTHVSREDWSGRTAVYICF